MKRLIRYFRKKREYLPDPWSGAICRERRYFTVNWNSTVGKAYRGLT